VTVPGAGPTSDADRDGSGLRRWLEPGALSAAAALVGAVVFVVLNLACVVFYTPLGVEPGDVGLGYAQLIAQAALAVLAIVVIALVITFAWTLLLSTLLPGLGPLANYVVTLPDRIFPNDQAREKVVTLGALIRNPDVRWTAAALVLAAGLAALAGGTAGGLALIAVGSLRAVLGAAHRRHAGFHGVLAAVTGPWRPALVFAGVAAVAAAITVFFLVFFATTDRSRVQQGRATLSVFGLPMPWSADVAEVRWVREPSAGEPLPTCVIHLGAADGSVVVFDPAADQALRLPASSILVVTDPDRRSCDGK
jgi:hypothetical protein